ncbi:MAG: hypothetical protein ACK4EX_11015 [Thermaurantimonas sp.]|uniref:hypothetical protein n=1 Tax=Thermaurantimonas sp. TaxID=2681568 RepID=UPI00391D1569
MTGARRLLHFFGVEGYERLRYRPHKVTNGDVLPGDVIWWRAIVMVEVVDKTCLMSMYCRMVWTRVVNAVREKKKNQQFISGGKVCKPGWRM